MACVQCGADGTDLFPQCPECGADLDSPHDAETIDLDQSPGRVASLLTHLGRRPAR